MKAVPFDVGLSTGNELRPFGRQLPVFNWFYPFDTASDRLSGPLSYFADVDWSSARRRALYIHIPFCETICRFCPFTRGLFSDVSELDTYLDALILEMRLKWSYLGRLSFDAVFIGGGTPSVLTASQIVRLGTAVNQYFDLEAAKEFSVEIEAKSASQEKLAAFRSIGVNRVSYGVQTFSIQHRKHLNLDATLDEIEVTSESCRSVFKYVNVDMIYGMAGQTVEHALEDARRAIALDTTTIDFYPMNNLAAQPQMHRAFAAANQLLLSAPQRTRQRQEIAKYMVSSGYARINGYGFARRSTPVLIQTSPHFLYHDILYGFQDDFVVGYGSGAITQVPGLNFYNDHSRSRYISCLMGASSLPFSAYRTAAHCEKGLVFLPYRGSAEKSRVPLKEISDATIEALSQLVRAGLLLDDADAYRVTETGWLYYVNMMYYLMPIRMKEILSDHIAARTGAGRTCEETAL